MFILFISIYEALDNLLNILESLLNLSYLRRDDMRGVGGGLEEMGQLARWGGVGGGG
jgi:hypothetical protein